MGVGDARGRFITLEGIEASGKTTLLLGLSARLQSAGIDAVVTREPGGTPVGDRLRAMLLDSAEPLQPLTELFVVCAARAEHVGSVIRPALEQGRVVLCDRFSDATRAYQGGGRGIDDATIRACSSAASGGLEPGLSVLLDVPEALSRERVGARTRSLNVPRDRLEREDDAFHARVRERYLFIARAEPARVKMVDGTQPATAVLEEAWRFVAAAVGIA